MSATFRIDWQATSDVGRVRKVNEDSHAAWPEKGIWVVADGMGGHAGGDWASASIVTALAHVPRGDDLDRVMADCVQALHATNAAIWQEAARRGASMGSTVVVLVLIGDRFAALWAGDSRLYLLRGGHLVQVTRDHSQVQAMVDRGLLKPEDVAGHPMGHVLSRAVGVQEMLELDVVTERVCPEDLFLLTSDGVHGVLSDAEMAQMLRGQAVSGGTRALVERGMAQGSTDNLTAVVVGVSEATQLVLGHPAGGRA